MNPVYTIRPIENPRIKQLKQKEKANKENINENYPNNSKIKYFTFYSEKGKNIPRTDIKKFPITPIQIFYSKTK
tara:strand:+ start:529 stop:750 length:222 start_codon:yes stop_codon:yes gene_type:complete